MEYLPRESTAAEYVATDFLPQEANQERNQGGSLAEVSFLRGTTVVDMGLADELAEATKVLLVRHGEARPRQPGEAEADRPLTELGRRQADALAAALRDLPIAAVYSSPMERARATAAAVVAVHRPALSVSILEELREVEPGLFRPAGLSAEEALREAEAAMDRLLRQDTLRWQDVPYTEDGASLRRRGRTALATIARGHPGATVVAVAHGGLINACLADILSLQADFFFPPLNTSVSLVALPPGFGTAAAGGARLLALNALPHAAHLPLAEVSGR